MTPAEPDSTRQPDGPPPSRRPVSTEERVLRTLTFWLRPAFVLRVLNRFQRVAGFDRAIALASSSLTALIPILVLLGAILPFSEGHSIADRMIARYRLTGAGAQAVRDALSPAGGTTTQITVFGAFLLIVASLSFARGMQRMFEQNWDLKALGVRNSINDLVWIFGVVLYMWFSWSVHDRLTVGRFELLANAVVLPFSVLLLAWSGRVLSGRRIGWRALLPFAILGAALIAGGLSFATVYLPRLFNTYASRYGVIGSVLAMISALFVLMMVVVVTAAVGREVADELERIRRGERPPDDEVQREWEALIRETRAQYDEYRRQLAVLRDDWRARIERWRNRHRDQRPR